MTNFYFSFMASLSEKRLKFFSAVLIFLSSIILRLVSFIQTPYANGWDSYFYLVQIKSLLEEGYMHSKDLSLIYPLMIAVQFIINDYELTYKVTAAILAGGFSVSMFYLAIKITGNKATACLVAAFTLFSPHLTYFASQYPKNLLGIILFLCLLISLNNNKPWMTILIIVLNFFGHRVTAILSITASALFILFKKYTWLGLILIALTLVVFSIAGLYLEGLLSIADAERFKGAFSHQLQFAPYSFIQSFGALLSPLWSMEVILLSFLFLLSLVAFVKTSIAKNSHPLLACLLLISLFLIFPFFTWNLESMGYRLFLVYILIAPIFLLYFSELFNKYKLTIPVLILCFVVLSPFSLKAYNPTTLDPPYGLYEKISERITSNFSKKDIELIIAHKSLAEYITFRAGIDVMPWVPEYTIPEDKLYRIATGISEQEIEYYLNSVNDSITELSPSYLLLKENDWQLLIKKLKEHNEEELLNHLYDWKNPSKTRPYYLLKNKK